MSWKAAPPPAYLAAPGRFLLREGAGFLQVLFAAFIFCSMASNAGGDRWLGVAGEWTAAGLIFAMGRYVPFVLPFMIIASGLRLMVARGAGSAGARALSQALGGGIFLFALSGAMAFAASLKADADHVSIFAAGGALGSFMLDREGLNLAAGLGSLGGLAMVSGLALIGAILFLGSVIGDAGVAVGRFLLVWMPSSAGRILADRSRAARPTERSSNPSAGSSGTRSDARPAPESARPSAPLADAHPKRARFWEFLHLGMLFHRIKASLRVRRAPMRALPAPARESRILPGPITRIQVEGEDRTLLGLDRPEDYEEVPETLDADWEPALDDEDRATDERISRNDDYKPPRRAAAPRAEKRAPAPAEEPWVAAAQVEIEIEKEESSPEASSRTFRLKRPVAPTAAAKHPEFDFSKPFNLPTLDLLAPSPPAVYKMTEAEAEELSRKIEQTLAQFKIDVQVVEVVQGPTVTRFALQISPGIRVSRILALESDLALALKAHQIRVLAPIPGQAAVGVEVPNRKTNPIYLRELLESDEFQGSNSPLTFALGKNISGEAVIADLAQMPHLLIAGATGAGKSVCLNTIIASLLFRNPPEKVRMVMIDPKRVELSVYQAIPHLLAPVVCEPRKAAAALAWTVEQMETRYKQLAELGVRNIDGYNAIVNDREPNRKAMGRDLKFMPHIVVIIDELADLMMVARNEIEEYIIRLAQMARAVGIHMILATQRPSVNVITGIIKANFPSRIAFRVSSKVDSRTILDANGAEALLGRGDMLYSPGGVNAFRLQGAFVSDMEIERLADFIRAQEKARYEKDDFETPASQAKKAKAQLMANALGSGQYPPGMQPGATGGLVPAKSPDFGGLAARAVMNDPGAASEEGSLEDALALQPIGMPTAGRAGSTPLPPADMESLTDEDLFDVALRLVLESKKASVSYIQRRLKIGYARAGRLMDLMEERGIVGPYQGSKPRELIVDPYEMLERLNDGQRF